MNAQNSLGRMFYLGLGGDRDPQQALHWFTEAADRGDPNAALNLGKALSGESASESDRIAALTWLEIAHKKGLEPGPALENLKAHLTTPQVDEAVRSASQWLEVH
jgi:TPR repeat protein